MTSSKININDQGFTATKILANAFFLLIRYFLSVTALHRLNQPNQEGTTRLDLVTKIKLSCIALCQGRNGLLFMPGSALESRVVSGTSLRARSTGRASIHLGQHRQKSVSRDHHPLYAPRFTTETAFWTMKQTIRAFSYHFGRQRDKKSERKRILQPIKTVEVHMMCTCITMDILQILALHFSTRTSKRRAFSIYILRQRDHLRSNDDGFLKSFYFSMVCQNSVFSHNTE
jgi:hypothetical protein